MTRPVASDSPILAPQPLALDSAELGAVHLVGVVPSGAGGTPPGDDPGESLLQPELGGQFPRVASEDDPAGVVEWVHPEPEPPVVAASGWSPPPDWAQGPSDGGLDPVEVDHRPLHSRNSAHPATTGGRRARAAFF